MTAFSFIWLSSFPKMTCSILELVSGGQTAPEIVHLTKSRIPRSDGSSSNFFPFLSPLHVCLVYQPEYLDVKNLLVAGGHSSIRLVRLGFYILPINFSVVP